MKSKVLDNVGDLFNEVYYVYKDKYNEEKDGLNTKNVTENIFYYEKLRLTDDYQYESEEAKEQQTSKKELLKNQQKRMRVILMNGLIKKKQT